MRIGFDAKRAFFNVSGLGNYSRNLIGALEKYYPSNQYLLYTPPNHPKHLYTPGPSSITCTPEKWIEKISPAVWRTFFLTKRLSDDHPDLFHGLSAELPAGIKKTGIPSLVTIHDLIFLRYPGLYPFLDRKIYVKKSRQACEQASRIIAISNQTKEDIIHFFRIDPHKIDVAYQSCHPQFFEKTEDKLRKEIRTRYNLPSSYILYVGTVEERKNLLGMVKAVEIARPGIPLVVVGKATSYINTVKKYINDHHPGEIIFLKNVLFNDLPALFQGATLFVYPSFFEGFGIPIIEALASGVPVITSTGGCFGEAGGPGSSYADPHSPESIAEAIQRILGDTSLRNNMIHEGRQYVSRFTPQETVKHIMNIYEKTINEKGD